MSKIQQCLLKHVHSIVAKNFVDLVEFQFLPVPFFASPGKKKQTCKSFFKLGLQSSQWIARSSVVVSQNRKTNIYEYTEQ